MSEMTFFRCIIATLTWSLATAPVYGMSPAEKVKALDSSLRNIEQSARHERHITGAGLLMLAAASGTAAVFSNQSSNADMRRDGPLIFGILGGATGLIGFLMLAMPRGYESLPQRFRKMQARNPVELAAKVKAGEQVLGKLAERGHYERMWIGAAATATGLGGMTWYFLNSDYLGGAMLYLGGFFLFAGIVSFVSDSPAETELKRLQEADDEIELGWSLSPIQGGMALQAGLRF